MAPPSPPPSSPSWVILSTYPRVAMLDNDADVSLVPLAVPPRVTLLSLAPRVLPSNVDSLRRLNFINAVDPSGLLLAVSPPTPFRPPFTTSAWSESDDNEADGVVTDPSLPDYLVLDLPSATATRVPDASGVVYDWRNLGVIAAPAGAPGFMLAEFDHRVISDSDKATLTCFSSQTGQWVYKVVENPRPGWIWGFDDVISHDAKLWWVDSTSGLLLACDPFADKPEMVYVLLPVMEKEEDDDDESDHASCYDYSERILSSYRHVQVSNGKFRCVDVTRALRGQGGFPTVTMRTLADPETAEWTLEYKVRFDETWGMPLKDPELGLIHPENPDVLYFFVEKYLFGVNTRARKVVECQAHELAKGAASPSSVLALVLPPAFATGLPAEVYDNGAKEDESGVLRKMIYCIGSCVFRLCNVH